MRQFDYPLIAIILTTTLLQGCVGAVLVGGTAAGGTVAHDRRTMKANMDDSAIEFELASQLSNDQELKAHTNVSATSYNAVLLLTGQAESSAYRDRYVALSQQITKLKRVVDEIEIAPDATLSEISSDSYVTSKVKLSLFDVQLPDFDPSRVKVITEKGSVYLMGLVTTVEADAVVQKVRYVKGVKRVVKVFEYVKEPVRE